MPAKKNVSGFTKISGFKRILKCRRCGKKFFSEKETGYCEACSNKNPN